MNCTKKITLTGYRVRYADLREPKPRTAYEEVYTLDKDGVAALGLLGLDVADFIASRYERGGYHVTSVERIAPKLTVSIDLRQLWTEAKSQALGNLEGNAHD